MPPLSTCPRRRSTGSHEATSTVGDSLTPTPLNGCRACVSAALTGVEWGWKLSEDRVDDALAKRASFCGICGQRSLRGVRRHAGVLGRPGRPARGSACPAGMTSRPSSSRGVKHEARPLRSHPWRQPRAAGSDVRGATRLANLMGVVAEITVNGCWDASRSRRDLRRAPRLRRRKRRRSFDEVRRSSAASPPRRTERTAFAIPCQSCGKDLKVVAMVFMYEPYCRRCALPAGGATSADVRGWNMIADAYIRRVVQESEPRDAAACHREASRGPRGQ